MRMTKRFDEPNKSNQFIKDVLLFIFLFFSITILPPLIELLVFGSSDYY